MAPVGGIVTQTELCRWGEQLGATLAPGDVVALRGALGAGKTTLAQAICRGFGISGEVTSPTYALVHRYAAARGVLWHVDLYRVAEASELTNLGWDEIMAGDAVVLVEWPERAGLLLPTTSVDIELQVAPGDVERRVLHVR